MFEEKNPANPPATGLDIDPMDVNEMVVELLKYLPEHQIKYWLQNSNYFDPQLKLELMDLCGKEFKNQVGCALSLYVSYKKHNAKKSEAKN